MPHPTVVLNAVGLTPDLIGDWSPRIKSFVESHHTRSLIPDLPAVTSSVQSSMLTGVSPAEHGIIGNGWYERQAAEVQFWKQSNHLVEARKVWDTARDHDPSLTCANLFWWFNMYSSVDWSVTPRPMYLADGRKRPDIHTHPGDLRDRLQADLGTFPLFHFWGPGADIRSTRWIADAAMLVDQWHHPDLTLIYLPHLDYQLQRTGPDGPDARRAVSQLDRVIGDLLDHYQDRGCQIILLSEYGIEPVHAPIAINRVLNAAGLIEVREELGGHHLIPGDCGAFAVADHQLAQIYLGDPSCRADVASLLQEVDGIETVFDPSASPDLGLDHARAGDLVAIAEHGRWFEYGWWLDDSNAPDYARTVDIHRKPGYDPLELILDPTIRFPKVTLAKTLAKRAMGFRTLLDVIPLNGSLICGSHGRNDLVGSGGPILSTTQECDLPDHVSCQCVHDVILTHLFGPQWSKEA